MLYNSYEYYIFNPQLSITLHWPLIENKRLNNNLCWKRLQGFYLVFAFHWEVGFSRGRRQQTRFWISIALGTGRWAMRGADWWSGRDVSRHFGRPIIVIPGCSVPLATKIRCMNNPAGGDCIVLAINLRFTNKHCVSICYYILLLWIFHGLQSRSSLAVQLSTRVMKTVLKNRLLSDCST